MIGQTLAHYRIRAAIGAGGMGEVYRATDTKLKRDVAIKVLPEGFARDDERGFLAFTEFSLQTSSYDVMILGEVAGLHRRGLGPGVVSDPP